MPYAVRLFRYAPQCMVIEAASLWGRAAVVSLAGYAIGPPCHAQTAMPAKRTAMPGSDAMRRRR